MDPKVLDKIEKTVDASTIPGFAVAGAGLGLLIGPAGFVIGGAVGAAVGLVVRRVKARQDEAANKLSVGPHGPGGGPDE